MLCLGIHIACTTHSCLDIKFSKRWASIVMPQEVFILKGIIPGMYMHRERRSIVHRIISAELNILVISYCLCGFQWHGDSCNTS